MATTGNDSINPWTLRETDDERIENNKGDEVLQHSWNYYGYKTVDENGNSQTGYEPIYLSDPEFDKVIGFYNVANGDNYYSTGDRLLKSGKNIGTVSANTTHEYIIMPFVTFSGKSSLKTNPTEMAIATYNGNAAWEKLDDTYYEKNYCTFSEDNYDDKGYIKHRYLRIPTFAEGVLLQSESVLYVVDANGNSTAAAKTSDGYYKIPITNDFKVQDIKYEVNTGDNTWSEFSVYERCFRFKAATEKAVSLMGYYVPKAPSS